jgi:hypothetical protein
LSVYCKSAHSKGDVLTQNYFFELAPGLEGESLIENPIKSSPTIPRIMKSNQVQAPDLKIISKSIGEHKKSKMAFIAQI